MSRTQKSSQRQFRRLPPPTDFNEHMTWRARWYLIITLSIGYILSSIGGLIGYLLTRDPHYLLFIAPTALVPFVRYLVPMDERRFILRKAQIENKEERTKANLQIQMLEKKLAETNLRVQMLEAELSRQQANKTNTLAAKG